MTEKKYTDLIEIISATDIAESYYKAQNRLLLLDYDGTLTPLMPLPELAAPGEDLLVLLYRLTQDPKNSVYIISGREYMTLGKWLGHIPLNLVAEHGAWIKSPDEDWNPSADLSAEWIAPVKELLDDYSSKCEGSFVELKSYSIAWHYRNADPGSVNALFDLLIADLENLAKQLPINIIKGNKVVEIKNKGVNKGTAVERILREQGFDFILACGDDTTDEDMFLQLVKTENAFTVKVGEGETYARYKAANPAHIAQFLQQFLD
ncbi:trehalose-phosphatase [Desertivirga brevis]|uniref:trehalose-phosphatase n=1 Tax=Desertivirga brevis TaxID=2810310 RepID=UPI001A95D2B0|nr:trehalose-phosphatase [Pedobacter sp. SYSU D00873]